MFKFDFSRVILDDLVVCGGESRLGDGEKRQDRERRGGRGRGIRVGEREGEVSSLYDERVTPECEI